MYVGRASHYLLFVFIYERPCEVDLFAAITDEFQLLSGRPREGPGKSKQESRRLSCKQRWFRVEVYSRVLINRCNACF